MPSSFRPWALSLCAALAQGAIAQDSPLMLPGDGAPTPAQALPAASPPSAAAREAERARERGQAAESREVGAMAALADACALDAPGRISEIISTQFGGSLITSASAIQTTQMLGAFAQGAAETLSEHQALSPERRQGECAFAKLRWEAYKSIPTLRSKRLGDDDLSELAFVSGFAQGRSAQCHPGQVLRERRVGRQSAVIITLASMSSADFKQILTRSHAAWLQGYQQGHALLAPSPGAKEPEALMPQPPSLLGAPSGKAARSAAPEPELTPEQAALEAQARRKSLSGLSCERAQSMLDGLEAVISARPDVLRQLLQAPARRLAKSGKMS